jgi:hypothetical protein
MQDMKVWSVNTLLKKLRNDLVMSLIEDDDNIKMDGPIITLKSRNGKHTFIQQSNGEWTTITKYDGSISQVKAVNYWHGQTSAGYTGDDRKEFYMKLMKKLFDDNGMMYAELGHNIYVGKKILTYYSQSGIMAVKSLDAKEEYTIPIFELLTKSEALYNIQKE